MIELARYDRATWTREVVAEHPSIPDVEPDLRRRCMGLLDRSTDPIRWWPRDVVWGTVLDLHRKGRHEDAHRLAVFLVWCDAQGHDFMWELVTHESAPAELVEKKTTVVDVELPFYDDGSASPNPPGSNPEGDQPMSDTKNQTFTAGELLVGREPGSNGRKTGAYLRTEGAHVVVRSEYGGEWWLVKDSVVRTDAADNPDVQAAVGVLIAAGVDAELFDSLQTAVTGKPTLSGGA